jgi:hypothetical protein
MVAVTGKTMAKSHPLHSPLQTVWQIDQFRLHPSESGTLHPDVKQLQTAEVSSTYHAAVNTKVLLTCGDNLL